jgi:hypothetical protein
MNHKELHAALAALGWTEDRRDSGTVFYYSPQDSVERCVQTVPDLPDLACCRERGGGRSECSPEEALAWARKHEAAAGRGADVTYEGGGGAMNMNLSALSLEELTQLDAAIAGELSVRSGTSLTIRTSDGEYVQSPPAGGAFLHIYFCTDQSESIDWYPSVDAARAALVRLGKAHHRACEGDYLNLSTAGCYPSWAQIAT